MVLILIFAQEKQATICTVGFSSVAVNRACIHSHGSDPARVTSAIPYSLSEHAYLVVINN